MDVAPSNSQRLVLIVGSPQSARTYLAWCLEQCGLVVADLQHRRSQMSRFAKHGQRLQLLLNSLRRQQDVTQGAEILAARRTAKLRRGVLEILRQLPSPIGLMSSTLLSDLPGWLRIIGHTSKTFDLTSVGSSNQSAAPLTPAADSPLFRVHTVGTFCSPQRLAPVVADSTSDTRDELEAVCRLQTWHQQSPFPLIEYMTERSQRYADAVSQTAGAMGLQPRRTEILRLMNRLQKPARKQTQPLADHDRRVYQYLRRHSVQEQLQRPLMLPPTWLREVAQTDRAAYLAAQHAPPNASFRKQEAAES